MVEILLDIIDKIINSLRSIKNGIINIIKWTPIIFKDRQWDDSYLFEIIRFKLVLMEKFFREEGHHVLAEKDANNMKICINLCDRILNDNYYDNIFESHDKKWGESEMKFNDNHSLTITRKNCITEKDYEKERKEFKRLIIKEEYLREQDLDLLFKIIRKNILRWWD